MNTIPEGACVLGKEEQLVYEAASVNTCVPVTLEPGCYRAELLGGAGGTNSNCLDFVEQNIVDIQAAIFSVDTETIAYVFRGGDGMGGADMFLFL